MEITNNGSKLFYKKEGKGSQHLLLFHGFAQDHTAFKSIVHNISDQYTCYNFDLFFHGKSVWSKGEMPVKKHDWKEFVSSFLKKEGIEEFSLLGFSVGAKFAFATLEAFPEKVNELYLLAPDGIHNNLWYTVATYPFVSRRIFKSTIKHPGWLFRAGKALRKFDIINPNLLRFAENQMNTVEKRKKVYYSWVAFRDLKFNLNHLADLINHHGIRTTISVGKRDPVIQSKLVNRFVRLLPNCQYHIVDGGHNSILTKLDKDYFIH